MQRMTLEMAGAFALALLVGSASAQDRGPDTRRAEALELVARHTATWDEPPTGTPADHAVDGPLLGNGDMLVAVGGSAAEQRFFLGKNDLWRLEAGHGAGSPVSFGELRVRVPGLAEGTWRATQDLDWPRVRVSCSVGDVGLMLTGEVLATSNLLVLTLVAEGATLDAELELHVGAGRGSVSSVEHRDGLIVGARSFEEGVDLMSGAAVACRVSGAITRPVDSAGGATRSLVLEPGVPVTVLVAMASSFDAEDYSAQAIQGVGLTQQQLVRLRREHGDWWGDYWARSFVELGMPALEAHYYQSLYTMGAASRDPRFPPGLFGWVTTDTPRWSGDYHLNYNHMAPFYALAAANRVEQSDPQDGPLLDFLERGRWYAREVTKTRGVLYPVGIGPLGIETTRLPEDSDSPNYESGGMFYQQRSNSAYCLVNLAQRWRCTFEPAYGRKIYPLVRDVVDFWEDYLVFEDGRYVIVGDAVHEGSGQNRNPILSLGLVRNAFDLALDLSHELGVDEERRAKWRHVLAHLSSWSTQERDGLEVFRYTEEGTAWWGDNTLGIQHIYPAGALGLDSDARWLAVAQNTIRAMQRWIDFNGSNSFFPAAVRVGFDPEVILERLGAYVAHTYPNGFQRGNPHGIENLSTTPNTLNMMLCMGHVPVGSAPGTQVLRLFPVWPTERDARFVDLRTWGAFLVSAELEGGRVQFVSVTSERGRDCTILNPWPGEQVRVARSGGGAEVVSGDRFTLSTAVGEVLRLKPAEE